MPIGFECEAQLVLLCMAQNMLHLNFKSVKWSFACKEQLTIGYEIQNYSLDEKEKTLLKN